MMMKKRNLPRAFALDAEVAQWLVDTAAADNRTPSNYLATLLSRIRDGVIPGLPECEKLSVTNPAKAAAFRKRCEMKRGKKTGDGRMKDPIPEKVRGLPDEADEASHDDKVHATDDVEAGS